jgi:putative membrane protein
MASAGIAGLIVLGVVSGFQLKVLSAEKGTAGSLSSRDYKFVCDAAEGGTLEVSLGQLATQQAGAQSVRDFGQRMVTDHQKADQELMQIIGQKGATLPDTSEKDSKTLEHYRKLAGTTFDSDYIKMMVSDHKKDVKVFQTEADKGEDPDVRGWAAKTFPTLQEHLSLAESTEASVNAMKP